VPSTSGAAHLVMGGSEIEAELAIFLQAVQETCPPNYCLGQKAVKTAGNGIPPPAHLLAAETLKYFADHLIGRSGLADREGEISILLFSHPGPYFLPIPPSPSVRRAKSGSRIKLLVGLFRWLA